MYIQDTILLLVSVGRIALAAPATQQSEVLGLQLIGSESQGTEPAVGVQYCGRIGDTPIHTYGDSYDTYSGPGFWITNNDGVGGDYFLYENSRDDHPWKYITIDNGDRRFVSVCPTWQGHIARGTASINLDGKVHNLGTWFQASIDEKGEIWGSVSFLQGSDGGGSVSTTDDSGQTRGCTSDVLAGAPENALATKGSGAKVLDKIIGDGASAASEGWMLNKCSPEQVYMQAEGGNPVIKSDNGRLEWVFEKGKF